MAEGNRSEADSAYKVAVKAVDKAVLHGLLHKKRRPQEERYDHQAQQAGLIPFLWSRKNRLQRRRFFYRIRHRSGG